ncbi:ATPase [Allosaccharopolyspora coralli]|uniref:ATPase n=1 Tax=Allosaccharopolyspora coralli TaxID=2665642 RepID=A0A5Q3QF14_9PSEU|nr:ATPase [Allosaccharopolyspora coralli]
MSSATTLVLGLDVGGTSSRAVLADLAGTTLGEGRADGGNPNSHPPERAAQQVTAAAREALGDTEPHRIARTVVGMAGVSKLSDPTVAAVFRKAWSDLGIVCPVRTVNDGEVAFAAGTSEPDGTVLIAGTGAIAGQIRDHEQDRVAGGYGWLLGDEGSAYWLGREAVRTTLQALDRGDDLGVLGAGVVDSLVDESAESVRKALITGANAGAPIELATLAPLVTTAVDNADPIAVDIVRRGAQHLVDTARTLRGAEDTTPIVLAGSLVASGNPVGDALRTELANRCPRAPLHVAGPGASGAAWLAARAVRTP